ncbi:hypothetical protein E8E14_011766 [Neopestalotiopsis sp. 37M]|nr:hypothetical protein E8E14_011766 [Neopestalotiopsis sp. 37M]
MLKKEGPPGDRTQNLLMSTDYSLRASYAHFGLVNGAMGTVIGFAWKKDKKNRVERSRPYLVHVLFDRYTGDQRHGVSVQDESKSDWTWNNWGKSSELATVSIA